VKIELSDNDIREIKTAVRDRAGVLKKEAERLIALGRRHESENLAATSKDLTERLSTSLSAALNNGDDEESEDDEEDEMTVTVTMEGEKPVTMKASEFNRAAKRITKDVNALRKFMGAGK
jgi:hypothetical protein